MFSACWHLLLLIPQVAHPLIVPPVLLRLPNISVIVANRLPNISVITATFGLAAEYESTVNPNDSSSFGWQQHVACEVVGSRGMDGADVWVSKLLY